MSSGKVCYVSKTTWDKLQMFRQSEDDSPGDLIRCAVDQALSRPRIEPRIPDWKRYEDEDAGTHDY